MEISRKQDVVNFPKIPSHKSSLSVDAKKFTEPICFYSLSLNKQQTLCKVWDGEKDHSAIKSIPYLILETWTHSWVSPTSLFHL